MYEDKQKARTPNDVGDRYIALGRAIKDDTTTLDELAGLASDCGLKLHFALSSDDETVFPNNIDMNSSGKRNVEEDHTRPSKGLFDSKTEGWEGDREA